MVSPQLDAPAIAGTLVQPPGGRPGIAPKRPCPTIAPIAAVQAFRGSSDEKSILARHKSRHTRRAESLGQTGNDTQA